MTQFYFTFCSDGFCGCGQNGLQEQVQKQGSQLGAVLLLGPEVTKAWMRLG